MPTALSVSSSAGMLSRVAYNIYWAARYLERAENIARFLAVNQDLTLDTHGSEADLWAPLISASGDEERYTKKYQHFTREKVITFLAFDRSYDNSIISSLWLARENARSIRNTISRDMWLQINSLYLSVQELSHRADCEENAVVAFSEVVKLGCITVQGITDASMSRNESWHWWRIGTMLERADKTSRMLDVKYFMLLPMPTDVGSNFDHVQWLALLDSASAAQMFRQEGQSMEPAAIAGYLILDQLFPRAIGYAIAEADKSLHAITSTPPGHFANNAERALGRLRSELSYADIESIIDYGLHQYLDDRQKNINKVDRLLYQNFFGGD